MRFFQRFHIIRRRPSALTPADQPSQSESTPTDSLHTVDMANLECNAPAIPDRQARAYSIVPPNQSHGQPRASTSNQTNEFVPRSVPVAPPRDDDIFVPVPNVQSTEADTTAAAQYFQQSQVAPPEYWDVFQQHSVSSAMSNTSPSAISSTTSPTDFGTFSSQMTEQSSATTPANVRQLNATAEFLKEQGNQLLREGHIQRAIDHYTIALTQAPGNPALLSNRAGAYGQLTPPQWENSHQDAVDATTSDPKFWKAWSRRGLASLKLNKPRDALMEFKRAEQEFRAVEGPGAVLGNAIRNGLEEAQRGVDRLNRWWDGSSNLTNLPNSFSASRVSASTGQGTLPPQTQTRSGTTSEPISTRPVRVPAATTTIHTTATIAPTTSQGMRPIISQGRAINPTLFDAAETFNPLSPPDYAPNLSSPDSTVRLLSQQELARQLNELEQNLRVINRGSYRLEMYLTADGYEAVSVVYTGFTIADLATVDLGGKPLEHSSFQGMYMRASFPGSTLANFDPETTDGYEGRLPGTVSLLGYGALYIDQQQLTYPPPVPILATATTPLPTVPVTTISNRVRDFIDNGPTAIGTTDVECYNNLRAIIGPERNHQLSHAERVNMQRQITELCQALNRSDSTQFVDLSNSRNISTHFLSPRAIGFNKFEYQMLLSYELLLRLRKEPSTTSYTNRIGRKISADLLISEQWMQNVRLILQYAPTNTLGQVFGGVTAFGVRYVFHSLIHDRQVEGMIRFAELLGWPYIHETRAYMENVINDLQSMIPIGLEVLDWIFGLMLPGKEFRLRVMACLVYASASTRAFKDPPFYASGLVLPEKSYWPNGNTLERVLGGMKDVRTVCGWTGPCPKVDDQNIKGWVRIRARKLPLPLPNADELEGMIEDDDRGANILDSQGTSGRPEPTDLWGRYGQRRSEDILREVLDINKWVEPQINIRPDYGRRVIFDKIRLQRLPPDITLVGLALQAGGYTEEERSEYQAILDFTINGITTSYTLYTTPCFVTAHPCVGTHVVFRTQARWFTRNVVSAADLKDYIWDGGQFLVINALGEGQEVLARAWCAERGRHAVIRKGTECCFSCAAMLAGKGGLAFNLLIWA